MKLKNSAAVDVRNAKMLEAVLSLCPNMTMIGFVDSGKPVAGFYLAEVEIPSMDELVSTLSDFGSKAEVWESL